MEVKEGGGGRTKDGIAERPRSLACSLCFLRSDKAFWLNQSTWSKQKTDQKNVNAHTTSPKSKHYKAR